MADTSNETRLSRIVESAEAFFEQPVVSVTAPKSENGANFRLHLSDRDVIATMRANSRRTQLEAFVLQSLSYYCDDVPECLGVVGEVMFQSDPGTQRLNHAILRQGAQGQTDLAARAVTGIFRFQEASRKTTLDEMLPQLGTNDIWLNNFVGAVDSLQPYSRGIADQFDRNEAREAIARPAKQFVKWDCRSRSAILGADDHLRWTDFEFAGMRHGAEDFACLIGDDTWSLAPDAMVDVMIACFDPHCGHKIANYLEYLSVYLTFHCVQRFKMTVKEAQKHGWLSTGAERRHTSMGVRPETAIRLCEVGRYFSAQSRITAPLARNFDDAKRAFQDMLQDDKSLQSA